MGAIDGFSYVGGTTNTADGLQMMVDEIFVTGNGDRDNVADIAIVITDGKANEREADTETQAIRAHNQGIRVIVLGITDAVDMAELDIIASSQNDIIMINDFSDLTGTLDAIVAIACPDVVTVTPAPTTTPTPSTAPSTSTVATPAPSTSLGPTTGPEPAGRCRTIRETIQ